MRRKDCGNSNSVDRNRRDHRSVHTPRLAVLIAVIVGASSADTLAGSLRLWPTTVVVGDVVQVRDICELRGFDRDTERKLADIVVTAAPPPGGSRVLHVEMVRTALASHKTNMAWITFGGASKCSVTRPSVVASPSESKTGPVGLKPRAGATTPATDFKAQDGRPAPAESLRGAVIRHFNAELARYRGKADVVFDRTSQQVLDLSGGSYEFKVRRRSGPQLGLIQIEVDVLAGGSKVQTVPLVVNVSMTRDVVMATRAINQGAPVRASDVHLMPVTFTRVNKLGISELASVIGQRAKRFIAAGNTLRPGQLESVPLVTRGQLVRLTSCAGSVQVVTTAKAMRDGLFGEAITVRSLDRRRLEFDARVVGPGAVWIGDGMRRHERIASAMGGRP